MVDGTGKGGGGARRKFGTPIDHFLNLYWGMYRTSQHSKWIYGEREEEMAGLLLLADTEADRGRGVVLGRAGGYGFPSTPCQAKLVICPSN